MMRTNKTMSEIVWHLFHIFCYFMLFSAFKEILHVRISLHFYCWRFCAFLFTKLKEEKMEEPKMLMDYNQHVLILGFLIYFVFGVAEWNSILRVSSLDHRTSCTFEYLWASNHLSLWSVLQITTLVIHTQNTWY